MISIEKSVNPEVQTANRLSQFFQILTLLSLVLSVCAFALLQTSWLWFWVWLILWLTVAVITFLVAINKQMAAIRAYRKALFKFSASRLHTLRVLKTPQDVMTHLDTLKGQTIRGEGNLFAELNRMMGSERCEEIRTTVFKYTKVD